MSIYIELGPEEERALLERARMSGRDLAGYVRRILQEHIRPPGQGSAQEDLIDYEAIESCALEVEGKDIPSIEEVRAALSKIAGSMAQVVIEEREDRS